MALFDDDSSQEMQFMRSSSKPSAAFGNIDLTVKEERKEKKEPRLQSTTSNTVTSMIRSSSHPKVAFFHLIFKAAALALYVLGYTVLNYIAWFVPCVLCLSIDFWITKNVSGRLLVGLRWWSEIDENGENNWKFENKNREEAGTNDYRVFWYSMYLNGAAWGLFFVWSVMRFYFSNLLIISIALSLQWSNIVGYWKCHKDMEAKLESNINSFITTNAFSAIRSGLFSTATTAT